MAQVLQALAFPSQLHAHAHPQRRAWRPEDGDAVCQECGAANPVWWAENELWNAVMGSEAGILCPTCFIITAQRQGYGRAGAWQVYPPASLRD